MTMYLKSGETSNVFWAPPGMLCQNDTLIGGWYFWDEVGQLGGGPFHTESTAIGELRKYAQSLNQDKRMDEQSNKNFRKAVNDGVVNTRHKFADHKIGE